MSLVSRIKDLTAAAIADIYKIPASGDDVLINQTKPEFEGDYTVVLFSLVKSLKQSPEKLGNEIGSYLTEKHAGVFISFNIIKGFLNLVIADSVFTETLTKELNTYKVPSDSRKKIMVEYSSPNTNKPLHLGHLRNNFLGWSIAEILKQSGHDVMKSCIVNDRGIHICKSMIAWQLFADGATPESTSIKGDHFVGDYYVLCENTIKEQARAIASKIEIDDYSDIDNEVIDKIRKLSNTIEKLTDEKDQEQKKKLLGERNDIYRSQTPIMRKASQMLVDWENGKPEVMELWKKMNNWVYKGFDETYKRIGSDFDKTYYESETYLSGRKFVDIGLERGVFFRKDDGSVWIDLTADGLDEKLVLRKDGTSVYITQDIGLAQQKFEEYPYDKSIYIIADEQIYHMKVLKLILQKLGMPYADGIFHLSYGMVELPGGRMKSREGTVVDADDLINEMIAIAAKHTTESGKVKDFTEEELKDLYDIIALGALKFFLLRVDPKKKMIFNPEESIDFHGFTGPFVQYTHARIKSILRKAGNTADNQHASFGLLKLEKELLLLLEQYSTVVEDATKEFNPASIAVYAFNVAKTFNSFYTEHSVMNAESEEKKALRLKLCERTAETIKHGVGLLGIRVPERM